MVLVTLLYKQKTLILKIQRASKTFIKCTADAAVELYHNNSQKFETTSTGVDVTGNVKADTFTIDHASNDWNFELMVLT